MKNRIITISRQFGSGGRYIGECVASRLGIGYYDKAIIAEIAEQTGLAEDFIEKAGEYSPTKSIFSYSFVGRNRAGVSIDDYLHKIQRKIILDIAQKGPCVIVGRCADYILRDRDDCVNIFIFGNKAEKISRITGIYGDTPKEAEQRMREMDKKRSINYKYFTDREWGKFENYTLMLNSSTVGIENCVDIIENIAK